MKNKNFGRKRQAIYILSNRKSTRIIKTLMDFFFFIKVKIKMVCFSVPSLNNGRGRQHFVLSPSWLPNSKDRLGWVCYKFYLFMICRKNFLPKQKLQSRLQWVIPQELQKHSIFQNRNAQWNRPQKKSNKFQSNT